MNAAIADGGIGAIQPWQIPHLGSGGLSNGRGIGQAAGGSGSGTAQGLGSTGVGATFAEGPALVSGNWFPVQHRGLYGGPGIRTGGAY